MLRKNIILQLWSKMPSINQISVFFNCQYVWKESIYHLQIFMEITIKGRYDFKVLVLLVGCVQLFPTSNQIVGWFDHQYLWKESISGFV